MRKLDPADIASLALDGMAADEYEIIADGLSRQVQAGLAGGVAALYPDLPQKPTRSPATPLSCVTHAAAWPAEDVAEKLLRDPAASSDSELVRRELRRRKRLDYTPSVAPEPRPNTKVH